MPTYRKYATLLLQHASHLVCTSFVHARKSKFNELSTTFQFHELSFACYLRWKSAFSPKARVSSVSFVLPCFEQRACVRSVVVVIMKITVFWDLHHVFSYVGTDVSEESFEFLFQDMYPVGPKLRKNFCHYISTKVSKGFMWKY